MTFIAKKVKGKYWRLMRHEIIERTGKNEEQGFESWRKETEVEPGITAKETRGR